MYSQASDITSTLVFLKNELHKKEGEVFDVTESSKMCTNGQAILLAMCQGVLYGVKYQKWSLQIISSDDYENKSELRE